MKRLLTIEWLKLKRYPPFWILALVYTALLLGLALWVPAFIEWWTQQGAQFNGVLPSAMPLFDFVDIWQNITFLGRFFFPVLAFLVITSVNNEFTYTTYKQNVIDGLSRLEWLVSKIILVVVISIFSGVLMTVAGLYLGYNYSSVQSAEVVLANLAFIPAYVLQTIAFLSLALFITLVVKRSILSFGLLLVYYWPGEKLIRYFLGDIVSSAEDFFPVQAILNVVKNPFPKYIFAEVQTTVDMASVLIGICYIALYWSLSYYFLKKQDIKT